MASWYPRLGLAALLVGMTLVAYWPTYQADFVDFDDPDYVRENAHVNSGPSAENLRWAFTSYHSSNWHPLTWISHMLDAELFGLDARGHHAANVALHAVNAALLFWLFVYMTGNLAASFALAALFAVHPINVESVAWISQRKTTLSTLFGILAIWCYAHYARHRDWRAYGGSLALFACSLMAKQTLVTLPFALLLLDYWPLERAELNPPAKSRVTWRTLARDWWRLFPEKLPFLALAVAACVVTVLVQHQAINALEKYPLDTRLGNVAISYVAYLGKMIWPAHLAAFYPLYSQDITSARVGVALAVLATITAACWYFGLRYRYLLTGWFWYLGTMVPVIGLIHVGAQSMADRYAYISFWGLWFIVVWGLGDCLLPLLRSNAYRKPLAAAAAGLLAVLVWLTYAQAGKWHDTVTLFEDAVAATEHNWMAHGVLADQYLSRGEYQHCLDHCRRGVACGRKLDQILSTQGRALYETGSKQEGLESLNKALNINPENALTHTNLGWVYSDLRKYDLAAQHLAKAARLLPESAPSSVKRTVYANWADALVQTNHPREALEKYETALAANPDDAFLLRCASEVDLQLGDPQRASRRLQRAMQLEPDNAKAALLMGQTWLALGDLPAAEQSFERVLRLAPNFPDATLKLADVLVRRGRTDEAIARLSQTLSGLERINGPQAEMARSMIITRLADIAAANGRAGEAIPRYEQALALWADNYEANNNFAWLLATSPQAERRDGKRALALARQACSLLQTPSPAAMGTLAAAHAANGQLPEAVRTAERAQALAGQAADSATVAALDSQLKAYRDGKPYIEGRLKP